MAKRGKSLNDIARQAQDLMERIGDGADRESESRRRRVRDAFLKYYRNMAKSNVLKNIEKRDRAKNGGILTEKGIGQQYAAKVGRTTYMGVSNG